MVPSNIYKFVNFENFKIIIFDAEYRFLWIYKYEYIEVRWLLRFRKFLQSMDARLREHFWWDWMELPFAVQSKDCIKIAATHKRTSAQWHSRDLLHYKHKHHKNHLQYIYHLTGLNFLTVFRMALNKLSIQKLDLAGKRVFMR